MLVICWNLCTNTIACILLYQEDHSAEVTYILDLLDIFEGYYLSFMMGCWSIHLLFSYIVYLWSWTTVHPLLFLPLKSVCNSLDCFCPFFPIMNRPTSILETYKIDPNKLYIMFFTCNIASLCNSQVTQQKTYKLIVSISF